MTIDFTTLILLLVIAVFLVVFLWKPKATKLGLGIVFATLRIVFGNLRILAFPLIMSLFVGLAFLYLSVSMPFFSGSFGLFFINLIFFLLLLVLGSNFIILVFYRYVLGIIVFDGQPSLAEIVREESARARAFVKLTLTLLSIKLLFSLTAALLRLRIWIDLFTGGNLSETLSQMLAFGFADQTISYAPIDYAVYKSSAKQAITKSYEINNPFR